MADILEEIEDLLEGLTPGEWMLRNMPNGNFQFETKEGKRICEIVPPVPVSDFALFGMSASILRRAADEIRVLRGDEEDERIQTAVSVAIEKAPIAGTVEGLRWVVDQMLRAILGEDAYLVQREILRRCRTDWSEGTEPPDSTT